MKVCDLVSDLLKAIYGCGDQPFLDASKLVECNNKLFISSIDEETGEEKIIEVEHAEFFPVVVTKDGDTIPGIVIS